jgi:hypothetical protein
MKAKNPQAFQQFQNLIKSTNNPQEYLNQIIGNYSPEQKAAFIKFANGYGVTAEQLQKYGINSK